MERTLVVPSCEITGNVKEPATPKIVFPLKIELATQSAIAALAKETVPPVV